MRRHPSPAGNTPGSTARTSVCWLLLLAALAGCGSKAGPAAPGTGTKAATGGPAATTPVAQSAVALADRARAAGIDFTYHNGKEAGHSAILESLGGGGGLFDFDRDGHLDILALGGGRFGPGETILPLPTGLFRNVGAWHYQPVGEISRIAGSRVYSHGCAIADYDNDGFEDVLVTGYGGLMLWRNSGDGTFIDVAQEAGLTDHEWSSSAGWGDFNNDGQLDLYVAHYVNWSFQNHPFCPGPAPDQRETCSPRQFTGLPDVCYHSQGDGTFTDVSSAVHLKTDGKGLGVVLSDFDLDGDLDAYVANDTVPNFLYQNQGSGDFEEVGHMSGTALSDMATADGSMGVAVGDYNLDGLPDIWVANYERESFALYRNEGNCFFQHVSQPSGVTAVGAMFVGFGTCFLDIDRDGDEDVWVTNGHVIQYPSNAPIKQVPLLFENVDLKRFRNIAPQAGTYCTTPHLGRGCAKGDLDNDGNLDLLVTHTNEPLALLENATPSRHGWLEVRLVGRASNRSAIGATATLQTTRGDALRQVSGGGSYLSHNDLTMFWGVPADRQIKGLAIRWPSGKTQQLGPLEPNQQLVLVEPAE